MSFQMPCVQAVPVTQRTLTPELTRFALRAYGSPFSTNGPSWKESLISLADVVHAETAEPKRVHGQRPWFQSVMTKPEFRIKPE